MCPPCTHPSTPLCLSLSPPPLPRGLLPLTHRLQCPQPLFRLGGATDGNNRIWLHRVGPTELIRGTGVPHPRTLCLQPCLFSAGVGGVEGWAGRDSYFCERTQASGMPCSPSSRGPSQAGRGGSCVNLPHRPTLSQPCHVSQAGKALGHKHHPLVPLGQPGISGALEGAAWGRGMASSQGRNQRRLLQAVSKKCFPWFARTRQWEAGDPAQPFHPILPHVTLAASSPATGPVPSQPPPEEAWGPRPSPRRWPGPAPLPCARPCVCVSACACHRVVKLCPSPSPNKRMALEAPVMQRSVS